MPDGAPAASGRRTRTPSRLPSRRGRAGRRSDGRRKAPERSSSARGIPRTLELTGTQCEPRLGRAGCLVLAGTPLVSPGDADDRVLRALARVLAVHGSARARWPPVTAVSAGSSCRTPYAAPDQLLEEGRRGAVGALDGEVHIFFCQHQRHVLAVKRSSDRSSATRSASSSTTTAGSRARARSVNCPATAAHAGPVIGESLGDENSPPSRGPSANIRGGRYTPRPRRRRP